MLLLCSGYFRRMMRVQLSSSIDREQSLRPM
jgi:hypothetical protein